MGSPSSSLLLIICAFLLYGKARTQSPSTESPSTAASASSTVVTIVDLSQELKEENPHHPVYTPLTRNTTILGSEEEHGYSFQIENICLPTHFGTHVDAPCHTVRSVWCVADIPLERLVLVPAAVFDIRSKVFLNDSMVEPDTQLTIQDITDWEERFGRIPEHSVILILTGWSRYWDNHTLYLGGAALQGVGAGELPVLRHPGLSPKAAEWIIRERPTIYGIGIDAVSIDYGKSRKFETHKALAQQNMYIIENLTNLDRLPATGALINIGAMKLGKNASGIPARVVATIYTTSNA